MTASTMRLRNVRSAARRWRAASCQSTKPRSRMPSFADAPLSSPCASTPSLCRPPATRTVTWSTAAPIRSPTSPTCGPLHAIPPRAIPTGNWLPPKPDIERMPSLRALAGLAVGFCLSAGSANAIELRGAKVEALSFAQLDGWQSDDHVAAFAAYMKSCGAILHADAAARKKRPMLGGLYKAGAQAKIVEAVGAVARQRARTFFEDNFKPVRILPGQRTYGFYTGADGFYTGYYEADVNGSRKPTDQFKIPLYSTTKATIGKKSKVFAQYDRKEIED